MYKNLHLLLISHLFEVNKQNVNVNKGQVKSLCDISSARLNILEQGFQHVHDNSLLKLTLHWPADDAS